MGLAVWEPVYYVAKHELFVYPGVRHFLTALGGIPLDRTRPVKTLNSFRRIEQLLKDRERIVIFPEGTYYPYAMGPGKHRLIGHILRSHDRLGPEAQPLPFFPLGIYYSREKFRPLVEVKIGPALYCPEGSDAETFTGEIIRRIGELSGLANP